ncbi:four-carbon acid sugar kinase family protein [Glycomyces sp. NPDC047010]|uniref:four-carbon acid sugar kinase family protein n=1 Tax=Glycomyces sp. NPDC047010 TaxID=3155023 RepID=UPI0033F49EC3
MKTIVLDDDPTGTQAATGVTVLFDTSADLLVAALRRDDAVYVQTNSRALPEPEAVALARRIRADGLAAGERLGEAVRFVLRGDSTLRGHVFAETEVFLSGGGVMVFAPAFPDGGRTTRGGVHYVRVGDEELPADRSEYAQDPVFGYTEGTLADFAAARSGRKPVPVPLDAVRGGGLDKAIASAPSGSVVLPDAVGAADIDAIAAAIEVAEARGVQVVVRSAAPLAAALAGVASDGLLPLPLTSDPGKVLLVCGSHTGGATSQLAPVVAAWGAPVVVDTRAALADPEAEGRAAAAAVLAALEAQPVAVLTSERDRSAGHGTLAHGERVMAALTAAVREVLPRVDTVVAKGGITSAEVARTGIGASSALVLGQVLPGVSAWSLRGRDGRERRYAVVPGNVGGPETLTEVLAAFGIA